MNKTPNYNPFWRVCGPFILYTVIQFVAQIIVSLVLVVTNTDELAKVYATLSEVSTDAEWTAAITNMTTYMMKVMLEHYVEITGVIALCTIPVMAVFFKKDRKREQEQNLLVNLKAPVQKYIFLPILGLAICLGFNCLIIMTDLAFVSESYLSSSSLFYSASFPVQVACIGIIVPISEELLFRGVIFKRLREVVDLKRAAIVSAIIFALIHSSFLQMVYAFVLALFLAYVYEKYGSFKAPVLLHISVNLISLICTECKILDLLYAAPILMAITVVICAFIGAVMFILIQKIKEKPVIE